MYTDLSIFIYIVVNNLICKIMRQHVITKTAKILRILSKKQNIIFCQLTKYHFMSTVIEELSTGQNDAAARLPIFSVCP